MANKGRLVFDTNILVRATLLSDSTAGQAFRKARQLGQILSSVPTAEELNEVLSREKFDRYITRDDRGRFLAAFIRVAIVIEISETITACRDPKDKFLELAVTGGATCIVTADKRSA